jgi:S1-C subfamily serine protease
MRPAVVMLILALAPAAAAAPVPRDRLPDPLGRGYMGIYINEGTLTIREVEPNTPAAAAGMRPGDTFVKLGTLEPQEFVQVQQYVAALRPGTPIRIALRRGSDLVVVVVRLGVRPTNVW